MSVLTTDEAAPASTIELGLPARIVLAALSAGAGVVHLAMAPSHALASTLDGVLFAAAGWFQLVFAGVVLLRPRRAWLATALAANLVFLGAWALARTAGLPFGAHEGIVEEVGQIDGLTAAFEGLLVVALTALLVRPRLGAGNRTEGVVVASMVPVAVLLLATGAVVSPEAAVHSHGEGEEAAGHTHGDDHGAADAEVIAAIQASRCDEAFNPVAYWTEADIAGIDTIGSSSDHGDHGATTSGPTQADPLEGRGSPLLDKLVSRMNTESEAEAGRLVAELAQASDDEYLAFLVELGKHGAGGHAHAATGDDTGGHGGHVGPTPWIAMTNPEQCQTLQTELDLARSTALAYPTAADAEAAGWRKVTPYVPGIAAHYMNFSLVDGTFAVDEPEMILYDGNGPDARVIGLSYYVLQDGDVEPTQGFTGDNDHYHRHIGLCSRGGVVIGDSTLTDEECAALGGSKGKNRNGWMSHAWVVPGCESPWGVFSGANPLLDGELPKVSGTDGGACAGSSVRDRYDLTPGQKAAAEATPAATSDDDEQAAGR